MTSKQKMYLVAAQYAARARDMTMQGDVLLRLSKLVDEDKAKEVLESLETLELIDKDGLLVEGKALGGDLLAKAGIKN